MKKGLLVIGLVLILLILSLFIINNKPKNDDINNDDISYEILDTIPENINFDKTISGDELVEFQKNFYLFIKMGEFPTGGYSISVKNVIKKDDKFIIYVQRTSPGPQDMVTQAFTYPYVCLKFNKKPNYDIKYYDSKE